MFPSIRDPRSLAVLTVTLLHGLAFVALGRAPDAGSRAEPVDLTVEMFALDAAAPAEAADPEARPDQRARAAAARRGAETPRMISAEAPAGAAAEALQAADLAGARFTAVSTAADDGVSTSPGDSDASGAVQSVAAPGGRPAADPYPAQVLAWIEQHKRYPDRGRAAAMEGTVVIAITLDRRGRVRAVDLVRSSGHGLLDAAALEQVRSATPFPAAPRDATWSRRRFETPIVYRLRPQRA